MIKQPYGEPDSVPTPMGWVSAEGQLVKSINLTPADIREWYTSQSTGPQMLHEAPTQSGTEQRIPEHMQREFWPK